MEINVQTDIRRRHVSRCYSRIGFAIARRLAKDGCKVMISSRKEANVNKALEELKTDPDIQNDHVQGLTCHVGKSGDRERLVQETISQFGRLDYLVSNAAVNPTFGSALDVSHPYGVDLNRELF